MDRRERIESILKDYVGTVTHTGTELERNNQIFFEKWFKDQDYLERNPDNYGFHDIEGDHLGRKVPWCLLKGEGRDTIILIHHTDIVDTDAYGVYSSLAYKPDEITQLYREGKVEISDEVKKDLDSGDWLFGRGVADMKGGASIHMALVEEYMKDKDFKGNIILMGLPDEENLSAGMRGAVTLLEDLKGKHDLDYLLLLNVEPHDRYNPDVQTLYDGSVGKLMPVVYVRGALTHVGHIFQGLNPINLLSEIVRRTEVNPDFLEKVGNTVTPPPTWLYMKDGKNVYDVSLPMSAAGYMSILTLAKPPKDIFEALRKTSVEAFEAVIEELNISYSKYLELKGEDQKKLPWKTNVKLYGELYQQAIEDSGDEFIEAIERHMEETKEGINNQSLTLIDGAYGIIEKTMEYVNDLSPMVVIALAPPYYPNVNNLMVPEGKKRIDSALEGMVRMVKDEWNQDCFVQNYFTGISDLSYGMFESDKENIGYIEDNMLMWKDVYYIPLGTIKDLSMPVLNVGPWGKDYHKYVERVYKVDLYERTPRMVDRLIKSLLG